MLEMAAVSYAAPVALPALQAAAAPVMAVAAPILAGGASATIAASSAPLILSGAVIAGIAYGTHRMVCWYRDPEPDREVDNDARERNEIAVGDFSRHGDRERVFEVRSERERPWADTGRDTLTAAEKLWEAAQLVKTCKPVEVALGTKKIAEASDPASRVIQDISKDIEYVAKETVNEFIDVRVKAVEGGYAHYSDLGFQ